MATLIIVEDDARLCGSIALMARETIPGLANIHATTTVDDALAALAAHPPREPLAIVSDYNLRDPRRDGLDVIAAAASAHPSSVRILMSGEDPERWSDRAEKELVDKFLPKPHLFPHLGRAIADAWAVSPAAR